MDKVISKVAALGVPGIVLIVAVGSTGLVGAASITAALAALGPFGMIGGIATLGVIGLISEAVAEFGIEKVVKAAISEQLKTKSKEEIILSVSKMPITKGLKINVLKHVEEA